jgi:hypothetical protein
MSQDHKNEGKVEQLQAQADAAEVEELDIEEFSKVHGGKPPKAKRYRIRIDREKYTVEVPEMNGRQILELAKKLPPENWLLNQKLKGGHVKPIGLTDVVDFRTPGIERFMTLPKDQNEGLGTPRRQFGLPEGDVEELEAAGFQWETIGAGGWLLVHGYELPAGYNVERASVAVQIPGGYPNTPLDMVFFNPLLSRRDGRPIPATQAFVQIDGANWQRWSRHYSPTHPWIPGEYNVITHLALVKHWLEREFTRN